MQDPTVQSWNQDPDFQSLPYKERKQVLDNYFNGRLADSEFYALPREEQDQIRANFSAAHIGEDPNPQPAPQVAPVETQEPAGLNLWGAVKEGAKDIVRNTMQTVQGSEEARNVEEEAKRFGVSGDRGPLQSLMTPGMRQDVVSGRYPGEPTGATPADQVTPAVNDANALEQGRQQILSEVVNALDSELLTPDGSYRRPDGFKGYVHDVFKMGPQIAVQIGTSVIGGPAAGALFMGSQIAGSSYQQNRQDDVDPERAFKAAIADAVMQTPLEQIGISKALSFWKPGAAASGAIKRIVESGGTEFLTEWIQKYPELAANIWAKGAEKDTGQMLDEFAEGFWEATKEGMYEGAVAAPFGAAGGGLSIVSNPQDENRKPINDTDQTDILKREAAKIFDDERTAEEAAPTDQTRTAGPTDLQLQNQETINQTTQFGDIASRANQPPEWFTRQQPTGEVPGQAVDQKQQQMEMDRRAGMTIPADVEQRLALPPGQGFELREQYPSSPFNPQLAQEISQQDQTLALPPGQGFILQEPRESSPFSPQLSEDINRLQTPALPPGQGFELVGDNPRGLDLVPSTSIPIGPPVSESKPAKAVAGVDSQAHEAATSPENDLPEPTEAQIEAGNYKKGHIKVSGLDITIENPEGSVRKGTDEDGKAWETTMQGHYGYFKRTEGKDGDQVDVFVGPETDSDKVFIVDQVNPNTGEFDEHKVVMGTTGEQAARDLYQSNYEDDWKGLGAITEMPIDEFKKWIKKGRQTKPVGEIKWQTPVVTEKEETPKPPTKHEKSIQEYQSWVKSLSDDDRSLIADELKKEPKRPSVALYRLKKALEKRKAEADKAEQPVEPKGNREPWQMTVEEYIGNETDRDAISIAKIGHVNQVRLASIVKPVPYKVLYQYRHNEWAKRAIKRLYPEKVEKPKNQEHSSTVTAGKPGASDKLAAWIQERLDAKEPFGWRPLFKQADKAFGGTQAEGAYTPKDAYDAVELGLNRFISNQFTTTPSTPSVDTAVNDAKRLIKLIQLIPTQTKRTEEQQQFQQFSTPPPFAFVANWVANINYDDVYLEPSAGIGGLAVFGKLAGANKVYVNELSPRRAELLKMIGFDKVFTENAEQLDNILPENIKPTVIVMNPPFSATGGRLSRNKSIYGARHIEQALERLAPNGRLVSIVGKGMADDRPAFTDWWKKTKKKYNVRVNVGVSGDAYAKYGTSFDNQLLVIDKTGPTTDTVLTGKAKSYEELIPLLKGVRDERTSISEQSQDKPTGKGGPKRSGSKSGTKQPVRTTTSELGAGEQEFDGDGQPTMGPGRRDGSLEPEQGDGRDTDGTGDRGEGGTRPGRPGTDRLSKDDTGTGERLDGGERADLPGSAEISINDLSDLIDEVAAEEGIIESPSKPAQKPSIKKAVEHTAKGAKKGLEAVADIIKGLNKVGAAGGDLPPLIAPEAYAQAKTHLAESYSEFMQAGNEMKAWVRHALVELKKLGAPFEISKNWVLNFFYSNDRPKIEKETPVGPISIETAEHSTKADSELTESLFEAYKPSRLRVKGAKTHIEATNNPLVESAAMAAVPTPKPTYSPHLPDNIIESGLLTLEQIEQIVMAGQSHQSMLPDGNRKGYFIGDGTGVGKGRTIAGIILDNWNQGRKKAVWVSKNRSLLNDAKRDTKAIGFNAPVFLLNNTPHGESVDVKSGILYVPYATLPQVSKTQKAPQGEISGRLKQIVDWFGKDYDGVIAFDEAHKMGNAIEQGEGRFAKQPSKMALSAIELQKLLPQARVVYVSATGATEVRNLAYAERLGLWGDNTAFRNKQAFINNGESGGVAAMELIARDMKAMGSYLARSLSYDGVEYEKLTHELTDNQVKIYDDLVEAWQVVIDNIEEAVDDTMGQFAESHFWSANQRFWNQVITAMQMPSVLRDIHRVLDAGESAVVQLVNTNAAAQDRQVSRAVIAGESLETIDFTPREILIDYVRSSFPVQQFEEYEDDDGNIQTRPVTNANGEPVMNQAAVRKRDALIERLGLLQVPHNPLDSIIDEFGTGTVAEVTGRSERYINGKREKRSEATKKKDVKAFMDGDKRVLVFSGAGATGASYHADLGSKNQQMRNHYILQAGWRADEATQGFGRTHRANQKQPPRYKLVSTNLHGQKRFVSSIARRLDQLGALTKGQREAGSHGMFKASDNLEGTHASNALAQLVGDLDAGDVESMTIDEFESKTGIRLRKEDDDGNVRLDVPSIKKFLNRILNVNVDFQNKLFREFDNRLSDIVARAEAKGEVDKGIEVLRAESVKIKDEKTIYHHDASDTDTKLYTLETTHKRKLYTWPEVHERYVMSEDGEFKHGYWRNMSSSNIFAVLGAGTKDMPDGSVEPVVLLKSVNATYIKKIPLSELNATGDDQKYEKVSRNDAKKMWDQQYSDTDKLRTEEQYFISGVILPIWDKIKGKMKVFRVQTDDGQRMIGRVVTEEEAKDTMRGLGVSVDAPKLTPDQAVEAVLENGSKLVLSNGWKLERRKVSGEDRIEITGDIASEFERIKEWGAFTEMIGYKTRAFIPTVKRRAMGTYGRIVKNYPVVDIIKSVSPEIENESAPRPSERTTVVDRQPPAGQGRVFYHESVRGEHGPEFIPVSDAKKVDIVPFADTFIAKKSGVSGKPVWVVSESKTGLKIKSGETRKGAISDAEITLNMVGEDKFKKTVNDMLEANGPSPWYKPLSNQRGQLDLTGLFTKDLPENASVEKRIDMGRRERMTKPPHWLAKKYPEFSEMYDRQKQRVKDRMAHLAQTMKEADRFFSLKGAELDEVRNLVFIFENKKVKGVSAPKFIKDDDGAYSLNDKHYDEYREALDELSISESVKDAYLDLRKTLDKDLATVFNAMSEMKDIDPTVLQEMRTAMGQIHNYFPHMRYGNNYIQAIDKGTGEVVYREHFEAPTGYIRKANRLIREREPELSEKHPDLTWKIGKVEKMPEEVFAIPVPIEAIEAVMNAAIDRLGDAEAKESFRQLLPQAVSDALKSRGWGSHMINRKNIPGFETEHIQRVLFDYKAGLYGWLTKMSAARDFSLTMSNVASQKKPVLWSSMRQYAYDMLENSDQMDRVIDGMRAVFFAKYLGMNVKTAALNTTQNIIAGWPRLSMEMDGSFGQVMHGAAADILKMIKKGKNLTEDEQRLLQELYEEGVTNANFLNEVRGRLEFGPSTVFNKTLKVMGLPMEIAERFNRCSLALAAYRAARSGKVKRFEGSAGHAAAKAFAEEVVEDAHFVYGKTNRPEMFRGPVGKWTSIAYTFRTFSHNLINLWTWMFKNEGASAVMRSVAATVAIGGMSSVPLYKTFMHLIRQLTGDDPEEIVVDATPGALRDMLLYGIPGLTGFNLGGSIGMEVPVFDKIKLDQSITEQLIRGSGEILGVPWAIIEDVEGSIRAAYSGNIGRAFEHIMPTSVSNPLKAFREYTVGQTSMSGKPINLPGSYGPRHLSAYEAGGKILGFQPVSSTKSYDVYQKIEDFKSYKLKHQREFANRIANALRNGKNISGVVQDIIEWNKKQSERGHYEYMITDQDITRGLRSRTKAGQPPNYMMPKALQLRKKYFNN